MFHNAAVFMCSEKPICYVKVLCNYVDNINVDKYVESMLKYLLSLYKVKFSYNRNILVLSAVHAWDIPEILQFHITVMAKYSRVKFEFALDKFLTFTLRIWQWILLAVWLL